MRAVSKYIPQVGDRYGTHVVVSPELRKSPTRIALWKVRCDCGREGWRRAPYVVSLLRCNACSRKIAGPRRPPAPRVRTPTYISWRSMWVRVKTRESYAALGADARWRDFQTFLRDMGERPSLRHTLDRIDNGRGYYADNCRWATPQEQQRNKRTTVVIQSAGETVPLRTLAERHGLSATRLYARIRAGWSVERAVREPIHAEKIRRRA